MNYRLQHNLFSNGYTVEARSPELDGSGFYPFAEIECLKSRYAAFRGVGKHKVQWIESNPAETLDQFALRLLTAHLKEQQPVNRKPDHTDNLALL
jgi:hypothetical protein